MSGFTNSARTIAAASVISAVVTGLAMPASAQSTARIGTSSIGSALYTLTVGVAQLMKEHAGINTTVEAVGGSSANMFALDAGKIEFALANSLAAYDAYHGKKPYRHKIDLYEVAEGQHSYRFLVASKKSGIRTPADLRGKRLVGVRPALPEIALITNAMLKVYGIPRSAVDVVTTTTTGEAMKYLKTGNVDAIVLPASPHAPNVAALAQQMDLVFVTIPKPKLDAMEKLLPPSLGEGMMKKGSFRGMDSDVNVFSVGSLMVASGGVSDDMAYKAAKAVFEHTKEFAGIYSSGREWTVANTLADPKLPFHPGVVRFFKQIGVWTARNEKIQKMSGAR